MLYHYLFILFPVGVLAGIISSSVGLASLVSYPALLALGIPPVYANVTNTAALIFTGVGSGIASKRELRGHGHNLIKLLPLTIIGSICGSILLLIAPATTFEHVVPFFIFGAALLILRPKQTSKDKSRQQSAISDENKEGMFRLKAAEVAYSIAILVVGAYTGYFGAAGGVIMLAIFAATSHAKFAEYNAMKNVSLGASNLVATLLYAIRSHIYWLAVAPLAAGLFIGGYIGPYIVRLIPSKVMKIVIAIGAMGLATSLFIQTYFG
ncbi:sulfite exporter TauE/SafE family protein [Sporolactobacillus pectinivorans]|uniref:sulfite exporter TauE/SafE family protein n=1 Tax=Sporolactobacillus pectinivorans TaxID=1591408 RepID=UPI000C257735|nr:sulfite exporter TauE/SafE family protein [Sporolactobacillus pectinivorans]